MASSSRTHKDGKKETRDWLELGLGFGSVSACASPSSSSSHLPFQQQQQQPQQPQTQNQSLGLGLGLGLANESCIVGCNYDLRDHDNMAPSLTWFKSPLSSWPLHLDSNSFLGGLNDRFMPVARPQSAGLWFTLRSSINRNGDQLPQVPKAYIRVKDENVTVFMVKTYLVRKLGLSNEAEVDVSCMGQKLSQSQTLKYVRDAIWVPGLIQSVNSRPATLVEYSHDDMFVNHLMSLHYERPCLFN
ncbi:E3 ubiquitin protein like [Actinidia chinensis var. chinensis]|uniref:E3 ubiquitin protein like n=1 Tax=Actinidia chinensis var. chinensis TaxID=1590841 RepID=A0A2R6RLE2_ACTCC|nr:E3 ubiquitin protein like [Actinidia chinensis var. chinensis]